MNSDVVVLIIEKLGELLPLIILLFGGMVSTRLTAWVRKWPVFQTEDQRSKIAGILADVVSGITSLVVTLVLLGLGWLGNYVQSGDLSTVGAAWFATWVAAWFSHKLNKVAVGVRGLSS